MDSLSNSEFQISTYVTDGFRKPATNQKSIMALGGTSIVWKLPLSEHLRFFMTKEVCGFHIARFPVAGGGPQKWLL